MKYGVLFILIFLFLQPIAPAFAAATSTSPNTATDSTQPDTVDSLSTEVPKTVQQQVSDVPASTTLETNEEPAHVQGESSSTVSHGDTATQDTSASFDTSTSSSVGVATSTTATQDPVASNTVTVATTTKSTQIDAASSTDVVSTAASASSSSAYPSGTLPTPDASSTSTPNVSSSQHLQTVSTSSSADRDISTTSAESEQIATGTQGLSTDISNDPASSTAMTRYATTSSSTPWTLTEHNSGTYTFDKKECANVGEGSFYCISSQTAPAFTTDGVFAAPDANGDREIFARVDGKEVQITNNDVDDAAPYYDPHSNRIVWQQSIHDRYQIISDDLDTGKIMQLTSTSYNNTQPVAYGNITLWQAWIGNNWEIMESDGTNVTQLTRNSLNNVAPQIRGDYIVWQTQFKEGWEIAVYDQKTKHINYIKTDSAGATAENPRFVLVYDSTDVQGDVRVVGYDPVKMISFVLQQVPVSVPKKLPEPDQTGQTRALLQNKSSLRDGELENLNATPASGNGTPNPTPTTTPQTGTLDLNTASSAPIATMGTTTAATSSQSYTLDLSTASSTSIGTVHTATTTGEVTVVSSGPQHSATNTLDIPDVVIPPKTASNSPEIR